MSENTDNSPLISVIIATRNEERYVERGIRSVLCGTMAPRQLEVIVADGGSTDSTRQIVSALAEEFPGSVRLIDNLRRTAPAGFNLGIQASRGRYISILSAHGSVDSNYFQVCLDKLTSSDVDAVGGGEVILPSDGSMQARMMVAILSSRFGVGASFRNRQEEGFVDTISPGLFHREVFERIGLFDERLVRNQDNELSSRLIKNGGRIYMIPTIKSYYHGRRDARKLFRQSFANGLYGVLAWRINPSSFRLRHGIPLFFVLFLIYGAFMSMQLPVFAWVYLSVIGLYGLLAVLASVEAGVRFRTLLAVIFPAIFLALHVSYGVGTLVGVFRFGAMKLPPNDVQKLPPRS